MPKKPISNFLLICIYLLFVFFIIFDFQISLFRAIFFSNGTLNISVHVWPVFPLERGAKMHLYWQQYVQSTTRRERVKIIYKTQFEKTNRKTLKIVQTLWKNTIKKIINKNK